MPSIDFRQHLELETPEHVVLDYEIAGVGSRVLAALADWCIVVLLLIVAALGASALHSASAWFVVFDLVLFYTIIWGYFALFEGLRQGQTPGKRWLGIRVIRDTGHGVTVGDAALRNLLLPIDLIGVIGIILIAVHPRARRLGDLVAGTVVVRDHPMIARAAPAPMAHATPGSVAAGAPELDDREFALLRGYIDRADTLPAPIRARFTVQLAERFAGRFPIRSADDATFLADLHAAELERRRGRFGVRGSSTGVSSRSAMGARLQARKGERWNEFRAMADRVSTDGLDALAARELPDFAARYREVAADLARARTYHAEPATLAELERLVTAGHSALYRVERHTWQRIGTFVARECPAAVVGARGYIALMFLVFTLPGLAGYALLRERPALAAEVIPDNMLERAEAGAARQARGEGYVVSPASERPLMAARIIVNNIGVGFTCFASGIVFGVGSLVAVGYNGLILGAISGYFANMGLLGYLWTFVAGHGPLELFSIWVAGAAGLLLGRAIIAPGDLPRGEALVIAGRRAIRMIVAVMVLLVCAGSIEGFVSSSTSSLSTRLALSLISVAFLALYLLGGARHARHADPAIPRR